MNDPPVQSLNVFLLKSTIATPVQALRDEAAGLPLHKLRPALNFDGALLVPPQRPSSPTWLAFVQNGVTADLGRLRNASARAVLFVHAKKRIFALTFGYGRTLLRPSAIERSFGLRVVLNTVDPKALRSVDAKTVQELTVQTRRQVSKGSSFDAFSLDTEIDLVRGMAGTPRDENFAKLVSGSDALHLRVPIEFDDLGRKCERILSAYGSKEYVKSGFGFIDQVRAVVDPVAIEQADARLLELLTTGSLEGIHLAPPGIIDWNRTDGFSFTRKGDTKIDLELADLLNVLSGEALTKARLERQHVYVREDGASAPIDSWPAYDALVAEMDLQGKRYVLSGGDWFEIDKSFADQIGKRAARIKEARIGLPSTTRKQKEGSYNKSAAKKLGLVLCDRKCIRSLGDPIEFCDLYTKKRQIVHVKRWSSSATLSHLFAQGLVSAEAFLSDEGFRADVRTLLGSAFAGHAPKGRPDSSRYEVVYAIVKKRTPGWRRSLPFFSQLQLVRAAERLRRIGYEPRVECIDLR